MPRPANRIYSAEDKRRVLTELTLRNGNVLATARATGVPRPTIVSWRNAAALAGEEVPRGYISEEVNFAELWKGVQVSALERLAVMLDQASGPKELAYIAGLASDRFLDHTQGRRGHVVNVDARQLSIGANLTDADRHAVLAAALGQAAADGLDGDDGVPVG